jgi:hypothetical protein
VIAAGGRPAGDHGLLAHRRRTDEARAEAAEAAEQVAALDDRVERSRGDLGRLEGESRAGRDQREQANKSLM